MHSLLVCHITNQQLPPPSTLRSTSQHTPINKVLDCNKKTVVLCLLYTFRIHTTPRVTLIAKKKSLHSSFTQYFDVHTTLVPHTHTMRRVRARSHYDCDIDCSNFFTLSFLFTLSRCQSGLLSCALVSTRSQQIVQHIQ